MVRYRRLQDFPVEERIDALIRNLKECEQRCDFSASGNRREEFSRMEMKRRMLVDAVDFLNNTPGVFSNVEIYEPIVDMARANLFRAIPLNEEAEDLFEPEDDEPQLERAWPHLQIVYEILRRMVAAPDLDVKAARTVLDHNFVLGMLDLFASPDPREREYAKTIFHRLYGKLLSLRSFVRKSLQNAFTRYVAENRCHTGIAEMLEILGSIINGFSIPLKEDHRNFLQHTLIRLHLPSSLPSYHVQLCFCLIQFIRKEPELVVHITYSLIRYWPVTHSRKAVMFLNELEEIMEFVVPDQFDEVADIVFDRLVQCIKSPHFQVAERALFFWNNEYVVQLVLYRKERFVPLLVPALLSNVEQHWNSNVRSLSGNVMNLLMEMDADLVEKHMAKHMAGYEAPDPVRLRLAEQNRVFDMLDQLNKSGKPTTPQRGSENGETIANIIKRLRDEAHVRAGRAVTNGTSSSRTSSSEEIFTLDPQM
ncbi:Serine/threonine-protein phosphatase 2A 56 kDa regulatory subunit delta isoform [Porphyridium purpureum]|uniref:Serine/threonine-protein phosphatase 2A 56 kDa regulatory subunit delta isoform n=1 Tax=Porphyridium purpureum TaxID=35688 RepID=A0A5J4YYQ1_PORPP|nr:Serine/threonine-protein phosphatase 2A 56 kDa regulatory subunit delta isoform [Porphyridium purpureum]|eukprot:POR7876..scf209_3